jgi:RNA polymerase sigma-70 factor (ECF subfamily)
MAGATISSKDLEAAKQGDEQAFARIVEPYRRELHAHCYRMLGSVFDADDALQDTTLRAWRALGRFEGRSSLRSWLYTIATNTCLTQIGRRPKRILPVDYGPPTDPHAGPGEPLVESVWIEPYPDAELGIEDGLAGPDARYEQRESLELAFVVALQHLPATQRAVLILREVLGYSAKEVAETLDTTVASVNSALQRARASIEARTPDRYVRAWEETDVDTVVSMLAEDATFAMPPAATWFGPLPEIETFLRGFAMVPRIRWKGIPTTANGQTAIGFYAWDEDAGAYLPFALNLLTFRDREIVDVTAFINRTTDAPDPESYHRWDGLPADARRLEGTFGRFGLPDRLEG